MVNIQVKAEPVLLDSISQPFLAPFFNFKAGAAALFNKGCDFFESLIDLFFVEVRLQDDSTLVGSQFLSPSRVHNSPSLMGWSEVDILRRPQIVRNSTLSQFGGRGPQKVGSTFLFRLNPSHCQVRAHEAAWGAFPSRASLWLRAIFRGSLKVSGLLHSNELKSRGFNVSRNPLFK